jgi:hypothetical protein
MTNISISAEGFEVVIISKDVLTSAEILSDECRGKKASYALPNKGT